MWRAVAGVDCKESLAEAGSTVETIRAAILNNAVSLRRVAFLSRVLEDSGRGTRLEARPIPAAEDEAKAAESLLWESLSDGTADCVLAEVRWAKPWPLPPWVRVNAFLARLNPRFALLHRASVKFAELPPAPRLSTSSLLARAQLDRARTGIEWVDLSGDITTRLHKLHLGQADGVVEAASDLIALGISDDAMDFLAIDTVLPAPGQGAWIVCSLSDRHDTEALFKQLDDRKAKICAKTERAFVGELDAPPECLIGARAWLQTKRLTLDACITSGEMAGVFARLSISGAPEQATELVAGRVEMFRHQGIVRQCRAKSDRGK